MVTSCCQTDEVPRVHRTPFGRDTSTPSSMNRSRSMVAFDEESLLSAAYCDVTFDCSSDYPAYSDRRRRADSAIETITTDVVEIAEIGSGKSHRAVPTIVVPPNVCYVVLRRILP
ncbi:unnamed protein product [Nippostrongylus brasiliensis]|uniref:Uncharacterized protein n=1 Tax=Nippostrongylus brasiliensis TaxID=27835 RepID=A0A0N4XKL5_NIPBR|nr:unnamed protein product [Nippostrongylus brasiliensis]